MGALMGVGLGIQASQAQVIPDGTLSTSVTATDALNFTIENGDAAGTNLFHSFDTFSIPTGGTAHFNNTIDIGIIFSRVTGGNVSSIDGLLSANGTADLFLLNPNGIVLGPNAQLNIGGSFIGTTAESILFQDNREFKATNTASPLLTISLPVGLQMGRQPQGITIQGEGHTQTYRESLSDSFDRSNSPGGIQLSHGKTLGLIGGDIGFDSGILTVEGGQIELGALGPNSLVEIDWSNPDQPFRYDSATTFGTIQLEERSLIDASEGGAIHLQGQTINLLNGSTLLIQNTDAQRGEHQASRALRIDATDTVVIEGNSLGGQAVSAARSENLDNGFGTDVLVTTQALNIRDGGTLGVYTQSSEKGGEVHVFATGTIDVDGFASGSPLVFSTIGTTSSGTGTAGNLLIDTNQLNITGGGLVSSATQGVGLGGDVTVNAKDSVALSDINPFTGTTSNLSVLALNAGDAGQLTVNTRQISLTNGGRIASVTLDSGAAGNLVVNASDVVEVEGRFTGDAGLVGNPELLVSAIIATSELSTPLTRQMLGLPPIPSGEAGSLTINTPILRVLDGASVSVRNDGTSGNAGSLRINADTVVLDRQGTITALATDGQGGDIFLTVDQLDIQNSAQINASTQTSQGGNITLNIADSVRLENHAQILANAQQAGQGGNITIQSPTLRLSQGSSISSDVQGTAIGGEVTISATELTILEGSRLSTITRGTGQAGNLSIQAATIHVSGMDNTEVDGVGLTSMPSFIGAGTFPDSSGQGGNLTIRGDRIRVADGGLISAGSLGNGGAGDIDIYATDSVEVDGMGELPIPFFNYFTPHPSRISASSVSDASAGSVSVQTPILSVRNGGVLEVNGDGEGGSGNLDISSDRISLLNNGSLQAQVAGGNRGNITLNAEETIVLQQGSQVTTNATNSASGGNIFISASFVIGIDNSDIIANAVQGNGGNINITAQSLFGLEFRDRLTPDNDITVSSQFGVSGTVEISDFNTDPHSGLMELPAGLVDSSNQISKECASNRDSTFIATGRGGILVHPTNLMDRARSWSDTRNLSAFLGNEEGNRSPALVKAPHSQATPLIEATNWYTNADGHIELRMTQARQANIQAHATCSARTKT